MASIKGKFHHLLVALQNLALATADKKVVRKVVCEPLLGCRKLVRFQLILYWPSRPSVVLLVDTRSKHRYFQIISTQQQIR